MKIIRLCCNCGWNVSGTKNRPEIRDTNYSYYCDRCARGVYINDTYQLSLSKENYFF